jgi:hypothetical protein
LCEDTSMIKNPSRAALIFIVASNLDLLNGRWANGYRKDLHYAKASRRKGRWQLFQSNGITLDRGFGLPGGSAQYDILSDESTSGSIKNTTIASLPVYHM